ncbi:MULTISPECIES: carboxymuconolactone decarboxylase family protein [Actinomadura]|uniref:Carboxymuconolactone decarboxylase family protein n=1 Tax=Actinomadura yumaensis TaxID=111807 RepID=A0ABW2CI42_9ACTN|nr:carboxymuconolactone decarboxylase family protein [Actinomadura sp. J1-007]MWK39960.1 carboxymuconolactone decarboxylase family protein [Actinomadura sp. J1-007]
MTAPRLPKLTPADLDEDQLALYHRIVSGPRAGGPQHFALQDRDGALNGPFGVMLHGPALGDPLQELGAAIRYRTTLSDRVREIAVLTVATATGSAFERHAHEPIARAAGLTDAELAGLRDGTFTGGDPAEAMAHALCARLLDGDDALTDAEYREAAAALGREGVLELVVLAGYYRTLAQMMNVFGISEV